MHRGEKSKQHSGCLYHPFYFWRIFTLRGKNSYNVKSGIIQKFFEDITIDYDMTCYASYFAEMAQHFTRENMEASQELLLLYMTLIAMQKGKSLLPLVRVIYEMRMMQMQGQGLELFECLFCHKPDAHGIFFGRRTGL